MTNRQSSIEFDRQVIRNEAMWVVNRILNEMSDTSSGNFLLKEMGLDSNDEIEKLVFAEFNIIYNWWKELRDSGNSGD